jgi:prevent-host-death family protein
VEESEQVRRRSATGIAAPRSVVTVTVNVREAKTQLSKLVDSAAKGEAYLITKAGRPLVKVTALDAPAAPQRPGFLAGEIAMPDDVDRMGEAEIEALFGSGA